MHARSTSSDAGSGAGRVVGAAGHAPAAIWLLVLLALALGLLNPLACVVHCLPRPLSVPAATEGYAAICHLPSPSGAEASLTGAKLTRSQAGTPQAAFAFVAPLLVVLVVGIRRVVPATFGWTASPQLFSRPLAPPPR